MATNVTTTYKCDLCGRDVDQAELAKLVQLLPEPEPGPWAADEFQRTKPVDICGRCSVKEPIQRVFRLNFERSRLAEAERVRQAEAEADPIPL
jgi:hypothetical protein